MATYYDKSVLSVTYTAQHYHKHFEDSNHFINVHDFMKQFNKYFARAVTGWVADKFISDHQFFFDNINYIKHLNKTVADDLLWIKEYVDKLRLYNNVSMVSSVDCSPSGTFSIKSNSFLK